MADEMNVALDADKLPSMNLVAPRFTCEVHGEHSSLVYIAAPGEKPEQEAWCCLCWREWMTAQGWKMKRELK